MTIDAALANPGVNHLGQLSANFPINTSLSPALKIPGNTICGFQIPSGWTAANLTFQVSYDQGQTFQEWYDDSGNEITVTVAAASVNIRTDAVYWLGVDAFKIRSGTAASPVTQLAAVSVVVRTRILP